MKRLQEYIVENVVDIFEGFFQAKDYSHRGDYKYIKMILSYLFGEDNNITLNICIKPGQKAPTPENSISLSPEDFDINYIKSKDGFNVNSYKDIDFSKFSVDDVSNILKKALKNNEVKNSIKGNIFYRIDKIPFSGVKVVTRDQEVTTCFLFNTIVNECNTLNEFDKIFSNPNDKETLNKIKSIIIKICDKYDNAWVKSFIYQMQAISKIIKEEHKENKFKSLKMERYGGDKEFNDWSLSITYANVIQDYASKLGMQKDSLDPTDVILFDEDDEETIKTILNNSNNLISKIKIDSENHHNDNSEFKNEFLKLYNIDIVTDNKSNENIFFKGLSLKKINDNYKIDKFNITENTEFNFDSLELINNQKYKIANKTIFIIVTGEIENKKRNEYITAIKEDNIIPDEQNIISTDVKHRYKICLRTNGNKIACDVAQCKQSSGLNNKSFTTGPSLGKCPVTIWNKHLKKYVSNFKESPNSSDIEIYKEGFIKMCDTLNDNQLTLILQDIITNAIKCGPNCLPFIVIH